MSKVYKIIANNVNKLIAETLIDWKPIPREKIIEKIRADVLKEVIYMIEQEKPDKQTDFHNEDGSKDAKVLATEMSLAYNQGVSDYHQNLKERIPKL